MQKRAADAPRASVGFRAALEAVPFCMIAEVKAASPSSGAMDPANVESALEIYDATSSVAAISISTLDEDYFKGSLLERFEQRRGRARGSRSSARTSSSTSTRSGKRGPTARTPCC